MLWLPAPGPSSEQKSARLPQGTPGTVEIRYIWVVGRGDPITPSPRPVALVLPGYIWPFGGGPALSQRASTLCRVSGRPEGGPDSLVECLPSLDQLTFSIS